LDVLNQRFEIWTYYWTY